MGNPVIDRRGAHQNARRPEGVGKHMGFIGFRGVDHLRGHAGPDDSPAQRLGHGLGQGIGGENLQLHGLFALSLAKLAQQTRGVLFAAPRAQVATSYSSVL